MMFEEKKKLLMLGSGAYDDLRNSRGFIIVCEFPLFESLFAFYTTRIFLCCEIALIFISIIYLIGMALGTSPRPFHNSKHFFPS